MLYQNQAKINYSLIYSKLIVKFTDPMWIKLPDMLKHLNTLKAFCLTLIIIYIQTNLNKNYLSEALFRTFSLKSYKWNL